MLAEVEEEAEAEAAEAEAVEAEAEAEAEAKHCSTGDQSLSHCFGKTHYHRMLRTYSCSDFRFLRPDIGQSTSCLRPRHIVTKQSWPGQQGGNQDKVL